MTRILEEYEQLLMQWSGFCEDVNGGHLLQIGVGNTCVLKGGYEIVPLQEYVAAG